MFSKSKRFGERVDVTPAVGSYDISKMPFDSEGGPVLFFREKRFKEAATNGNNDESLLDISNCSSVSTKSSASCTSNNSVFATPGKPCGKAKGSKSRQPIANDKEKKSLERKISKMQDELERLRSENERLKKIQDVDTELESTESLTCRISALMEELDRLKDENKSLNMKLHELEIASEERQTLESNLIVLNDELAKLRKEIEDEILRNKELVIEQNKYECSLETMKSDLNLANSQVTALQGQIDSLEQLNADISESRDDLENQCTKLHGMTIGLQEENLTLRDRLDVAEKARKNIETSKNCLEKQLLSCERKHKTCMEALESTLRDKVSSLAQLSEQKKSLEESIVVHKDKIERQKLELENFLEAQKKIDEETKVLREEKEASLISIKQLEEKQESIMHCTRQEISQLRDDMRRKDEQSLKSLQNLTGKCQMLEEQLATLQKERDAKIQNLQRELELSKTSLDNNQEEYKSLNQAFKEMKNDYDVERTNRLQLEQKFHNVRENMMKVEHEFAEAKAHIAKHEQREKEQDTATKELSTKLEECDKTISYLEKTNAKNRDVLDQNSSFKDEIERLEELLSKIRDENRTLIAAEEKEGKLKQEFGRRLVETQKKLSQKEIELQSCEKEFQNHISKCSGQESWKRKYEELEERIAPFQEQLDGYEFEKQALLSQNSESQSEIDKLGQQYAKLLGHQNQKQKIRHVLKLKEENTNLKKEVAKLQQETSKQKQSMRKLEEKLNKATGKRRFDPSLAFKHNAPENKENTPLKTRSK